MTVFGVQVWTLHCSGRLDVAHKSPSTFVIVFASSSISDSALLNFSFAFALLFVCSIRTTATKTKLRCSKYTLSKNVFFCFLLLLLLNRVLHIDVGLSRLYLLVSRAGLLHSLCCLKFCDPGSVRGRLHSEVAGEVPISSCSSAGSTFPTHLLIVGRSSLVFHWSWPSVSSLAVVETAVLRPSAPPSCPSKFKASQGHAYRTIQHFSLAAPFRCADATGSATMMEGACGGISPENGYQQMHINKKCRYVYTNLW